MGHRDPAWRRVNCRATLYTSERRRGNTVLHRRREPDAVLVRGTVMRNGRRIASSTDAAGVDSCSVSGS